MEHLSIIELYKMKDRVIEQGMESDEIMDVVLEAISNKENLMLETSATGGPAGSASGSGAVVSAQPSGLAGQTIGPNWASNGGTTGSGDVSVPYNPGGSNRMSQNIKVMGKEHGPRTGKKSREKKLDMKTLKTLFANRPKFGEEGKDYKPGEKKVMDFEDFVKTDINKVKK